MLHAYAAAIVVIIFIPVCILLIHHIYSSMHHADRASLAGTNLMFVIIAASS